LACVAFTYGIAEKKNQVGQVTGLAWTEVGGDLLTVEAVALPGKGKTTTTGKLGDVMNESIAAALSVVRHRSKALGIQPDFYQKTDLHIHLPEGATPKDGPSAGGAIVTAIVSILTGIPVRADVAMTGEITLRGEVLPIGGLKEKLLAAGRGGIKTVLIPEENVKDLAEIPTRSRTVSTFSRCAGSSTCWRRRSSGNRRRCRRPSPMLPLPFRRHPLRTTSRRHQALGRSSVALP
jgi:ATP-dependent Lon protease